MQLKPGDKTLIAMIITIILSYLTWYNFSAIITTSYMGHMWELYGFWGWIGFFMVTAISTTVFGYILKIYNQDINNITFASNWGLSFLVLGLGDILAPLVAFILRKTSQSDLMANGNK